GLRGFPAGMADLRSLAVGRLFERDLHRVAQVAAAIALRAAGPAAAPAGPAEDVAEDVAEGLREPAEALCARAAAEARAAHVRVDARVAVLVVGCSLLRVREHFVGLLGLL